MKNNDGIAIIPGAEEVKNQSMTMIETKNRLGKLILGTAQFGLDYGINNDKGKILQNEVDKILSYAAKNNINTLDTADSYGTSEEKIGTHINDNKYHNLKIITKTKASSRNNIKINFLNSLNKLNVQKLYGYLSHDFRSYISSPQARNFFIELKKKKLVEKIGISIYFPGELDELIKKKIEFDIIQIPYNIFDVRFEKYLPTLKNMGKEIHVRSIFLQGLVFKNPNRLAGGFQKIKPKLIKLHQLAPKNNTSVLSICLNFCFANSDIDKIVVGVDSLSNLKEIVATCNDENVLGVDFEKVKTVFKEEDEDIILPINWKK